MPRCCRAAAHAASLSLRGEFNKTKLLCLYGLGTNTGLSRVSVGDHGVSESQLKYIRRRFISTEGLRAAID